MRKLSLSSLAAGLFLSSVSVWAQSNACDLNGDGVVNTADVQAAISMSLGASPCTANIVGANVCNVIVVQRVIDASLGQTCLSSTGLHVVALNWTASTSSGISSYQISRGTVSGGPYTPVGSVGASTTSFTDTTVVSGQTYYYVVAAVAGSSTSPASSPTVATVPTP
jgi:hypothetical protein